tara:strand:+ start:496 stop:1680 length:1185 start_codon:yes stop_codon:yes gene_type:complete
MILKKTILTYFLLFSRIIFAQVCPDEDYPDYYFCYEIQQFITDYPDCSRLPSTLRLPYDGGDLTNYPALLQLDSISGNLICSECEITSFAGLSHLTYVGGTIHINEPHDTIENLEGLNNLTHIGGYLRFTECYTITSTIGLGTLTSLGGFSMSECSNLTEFIGFENIELIPGNFSISECGQTPQNLSGFESVNFIGGDLIIDENNGMNSLEGLNNLRTLGGDLEIEDNLILEDIDALINLSNVGGEIDISDNEELQNLEGLTSLISINGPIKIRNNESLMSLSGLDNIDPSGITELTILNSSILSSCSVNSICQYITNSLGPNDIDSNAEGCNSEIQITESCIGMNLHENNNLTNQNSDLLKMIDVLGREHIEHQKGMILFYIYTNGKVIKRMK